MKVAVTGGTGFVGDYVVHALIDRNINVVVIGTDHNKARTRKWFNSVEFIEFNINNLYDEEPVKKIASCDKLIHLAWTGLPNYNESFHFEKNLLPQYLFLKRIIELGLKDITVTGTCFEYGLKSGPLDVMTITEPVSSYAIAKDTLRKFLQKLQMDTQFKLKWVRLFYLYGKGQSEKSILAQLDKAIANGETSFNMSAGEQLRDYLPIEDAALDIIEKCLDNELDGLINCCSGVPISIRTLVENHLKKQNKSIQLNLGYYPYPDYEPMAFWGIK
jgi:dTDP-6-deoxy-L-talose 4-dehydrogenase (NAD+)